MNMNPKEYDAYVKQMGPKSPIWKDCFHAFWIGGLICVLGQLIQNGFAAAGLDKTDAGTATSMSLVASIWKWDLPQLQFLALCFQYGCISELYSDSRGPKPPGPFSHPHH